VSADGSLVFTARGNGSVYALDAATGATIWSTAVPGATSFGGSPVLSGNGILYLVGDSSSNSNGRVFAVSASNGALLWQYELDHYWSYWGPQSPALGADGTLYVLSSGNRLYAFR
jgi:outer membrane protein assembly factor BamB